MSLDFPGSGLNICTESVFRGSGCMQCTTDICSESWMPGFRLHVVEMGRAPEYLQWFLVVGYGCM